MQDKETVDEAEEVLTLEKKDSLEGHSKKDKDKEPTKEGKFAFRKMKQPKKEKPDKNSPSRFEGEGVIFKAKLIGLESVSDARGDKMCQEAMQRLKLNVRNAGPHKRKITVCVSLQGIKIKDEKTGVVIFHHPVSLISFISQDITDARAFGYVFGSVEEPHQFIAIKTEKPAFHVVLALRDLFQTVLNYKQEEIQNVKESKSDTKKVEKIDESQEVQDIMTTESEVIKSPEEQKPETENIYFEVLLTEPLKMQEPETTKSEPIKTVDELLDLQHELNQLQQGIEQMDTSIAAAAAFNQGQTQENDPFDTSFVLGPKRDSFPLAMPTPIPVATSLSPNEQFNNQLTCEDKYAVFNALDSGPSIFELATSEGNETSAFPDIKDLEEEIQKKSIAPPKPPRQSKTSLSDQSVFADLDPLGKDRPYKDKTEFFQDVKNPPKKVLNDLVEKNDESNKSFDASVKSVPFPASFDSVPNTNVTLSSSLPNSFVANSKLSLPYSHTNNAANLYNPFDVALTMGKSTSNLTTKVNNNNSYLGRSPPANTILASTQHQPLIVNGNLNHQNSTSSSPIPIPPRQMTFTNDRSHSNGSISSPYSKSPISFDSESPTHIDYLNINSVGLILKNGSTHPDDIKSPVPQPSTNNHLANNNTKPNSNSAIGNGMSRPRPRPTLNKGSSVSSGSSSHSSCSDSSSDYEVISRENMQSIANVLLTNGHRLRAQSLNFEPHSNIKIQDKTIFTKTKDPFDDDFFFSLPKKTPSHLGNNEISEYV